LLLAKKGAGKGAGKVVPVPSTT